jgi:tripartite-type tricarboxylate transporter receptor subunit TctC
VNHLFNWYTNTSCTSSALHGAARTPTPIIDRLQAELLKALQFPEAKERILGLGAEPIGSTSKDAAAFLKNETARWARVAKEARIPLVE